MEIHKGRASKLCFANILIPNFEHTSTISRFEIELFAHNLKLIIEICYRCMIPVSKLFFSFSGMKCHNLAIKLWFLYFKIFNKQIILIFKIVVVLKYIRPIKTTFIFRHIIAKLTTPQGCPPTIHYPHIITNTPLSRLAN